MNTKLILVEGIPGAGKSSTASFIAKSLNNRGVQCDLFSEGDVNHPADYESVACLSHPQFEEIVADHPKFEEALRAAVIEHGSDLFLPYGKLAEEVELPENLISAVRRFDVYELPSDKFCDVLLKRWSDFGTRQAESDRVVIFECCFLQNTTTQLFVRNDEAKEYISRHIVRLTEAIQKLNPIVIYLNPSDVGDTIHRVCKERTKEWLDFVVWYHTQQGYGKKRELNGVDGYVEVLHARKALELDILSTLPVHVVQIENPARDWSRTHEEIEERIYM